MNTKKSQKPNYRGGRRENAGRKPNWNNKDTITIRVQKFIATYASNYTALKTQVFQLFLVPFVSAKTVISAVDFIEKSNIKSFI